MLSQMCRNPACLDAPWALANSCLLVAAVLPEGAAEGYYAHGSCFAFVWVFVSLLPSSPALDFQMFISTEVRLGVGVQGISHHCLAFAFLLEPLG